MSMQYLKKLYRSNYAGENIVTQLTLSGGEWTPDTEFVPNSVFNTHITTQAIAVGNGESRKDFDLRFIQHHQGGILATNRLQSYACNAAYRDFTPDFLIATGDEIIKEIADSGYCDENIVYANARAILEYPGKFYLIPQNPLLNSGAIAAYMACFDGHSKVFLMGYDSYDTHSAVNNIYKGTNGYPASTDVDNGKFFGLSLASVVDTYSDVEFVNVVPTDDYFIHDELVASVNFRQINYRDFVLEADIGSIA